MANILDSITVGDIDIVTVSANPSTGVASPIGSLAIVVDGSGMFLKTSAVTTDWYQLPTLSASGLLSAAAGGTGQGTYTIGDILYADTISTLAKLSDTSTGNAIISGGTGVAPSWGKIGLTTHVSGTLPATNGGTGFGAFTTGDIVYSSATNVLSKLGIGSTANVLTVVAGVPAWSPISLAIGAAVTGGSTGSVLFIGAGSTLAGSANYTYVDNGQLNIGALNNTGTYLSIGGVTRNSGNTTLALNSGASTNYIEFWNRSTSQAFQIGLLSGGFTLASNGSTHGPSLFIDNASGGVNIGTNLTIPGKFGVAGNTSAASWTISGIQSTFAAATYTDTGSAGTRVSGVANSFAIPTFASTNTVTITTASTVYIDGPPVAGTNMTLSGVYSLWINSGRINHTGGVIAVGANLSVQLSSGALTTLTAGSIEIGTSGSGVTANNLFVKGFANLNNGGANFTRAVVQTALVVGSSASDTNFMEFWCTANTAAWIVGASSKNLVFQPGTGGAAGTQMALNYTTGNLSVGSGAGFNAVMQVGKDLAAASWTTNGIQTRFDAQNFTDTGTAGTRTIASMVSIAGSTLIGTNAVTITDSASLYITPPVAGANMTLTNIWGIWNTGSSRIDGSLKLNAFTQGSIPFIGASGILSQDNIKFFWDDTNFRLGIGALSPTDTLTVTGTSSLMGRVAINASPDNSAMLKIPSTLGISQAIVASSSSAYSVATFTQSGTASSALNINYTGTGGGPGTSTSIVVTNSSTANSQIGISATSNGTATGTNVGGYFSASGGAINYAIQVVGHIVPITTNVNDLGTAALLFRNAYFAGSTTLGTIVSGAWNGTTISSTYGGTGFSTYTTGDIIFASATNVLSKLSIGSTTQVLTVVSGAPAWAPISAVPYTGATQNVDLGNNTIAGAAYLSLQTTVADMIIAAGYAAIMPDWLEIGLNTTTEIGIGSVYEIT